MKKIFLPLLTLISTAISQSVVTYTESLDIIANPERGLQKYSITNSNYATTPNYSNINQNSITNWRTGSDKVTVIYRAFLLEAFLSSNISQTYLDNMQKDFDRIRNAGLKVIIRFSYSDNVTANPQQPNKSQILQHISQLTPLLNTNKDIILIHQAGFIGTYGEWYYTNSTEFGTEDNILTYQWSNRKDVLDAMLAATPTEIPIQVRYPGIKTLLYGSTPLDSANAFLNTPNARIGFFNDAFLNDWGDHGTYRVNSQFENPVGTTDYLYLSNETKFTPMSGETNGINFPRTNASNAIYELDLTNFSLLNRDYYTQNFTNWIDSGAYENIVRNLGYRFVLTSSEFDVIGNNLSIKLNILNKGFANAFTEKNIYLITQNTSNNIKDTFLINTDIRFWDSTTQINRNIDVSTLNSGNYECYLSISDKLLPNRTEYNIQLSNNNIWIDSLGLNKLNQTFSINAVGNLITNNNYELKIYPNPTNGIINLELPEKQKDYSIIIYNREGKKLENYKIKNQFNSFDLSSYRNGIYYLNIILSSGEVINKKITLLK